jgi:hypothetical protein
MGVPDWDPAFGKVGVPILKTQKVAVPQFQLKNALAMLVRTIIISIHEHAT